jgi:hypothetical protein
MKTIRVITAYKAKYHDPLIARAEESVTIGRHDDEWLGWIWCTGESGKGSWVHESFLEIQGDRAVFLEDYSAQELTVEAGDRLTVLRETGGWFWCETATGSRGWIPADVTVILD